MNSVNILSAAFVNIIIIIRVIIISSAVVDHVSTEITGNAYKTGITPSADSLSKCLMGTLPCTIIHSHVQHPDFNYAAGLHCCYSPGLTPLFAKAGTEPTTYAMPVLIVTLNHQGSIIDVDLDQSLPINRRV